MKKIQDVARAKKLMEQSVKKLGLNLRGMNVLTEAASGNFIVTPLIAALAGAFKIYAVVRDTGYGSVEELLTYLSEWQNILEIPQNTIKPIMEPIEAAENAQIVTNLRSVRPINKTLINKLPDDASICLMMETWEYRTEDVDLEACIKRNIPVLGTNEYDVRLNIIKYVGILALKLLLEKGIELFESKVGLISSGKFADEIKGALERNGASVFVYDPILKRADPGFFVNLSDVDAIVLAEQQETGILLSETDGEIPISLIKDSKPIIIHICGRVDINLFQKGILEKYPERNVEAGYMTVTTDYVGLKPIIDLHTAGLKVGQAMTEGMRKYKNSAEKAKEYALANSPAMDF